MKAILQEIFSSQPDQHDHDLFLHGACKEKSIVIIDDDPTGCQTVYDAPVLFVWDTETIISLFQAKCHLFFILTNTRSMPEEEAVRTLEEVMESVIEAGKIAQQEFIVISRSDSTLRGHYPAETNAIDRLLGNESMHCLVPAFFQGGRFTCNDVHYVKEGSYLIPVGETPYSKDKSFGFTSSNIKEYVQEKTKGAVPEYQVLSFSVEDLRLKGPAFVKETLLSTERKVCFVNALSQSDLDIFSAGAWEAIIEGKKILFRTAASFINSFACIPVKETLKQRDLRGKSTNGGLFVVGSYVPKSSAQLYMLLDQGDVSPLELNVESLLNDKGKELIASLAYQASQLIKNGHHPVIYTSRELVSTNDVTKNLEIGKVVSDALVEIVRKITFTPSFIVAKGGITSHEIALYGLNMKRTSVIGQALPGVPVLVPDDRPDMKYIVFPGNVGEEADLLKLFRKLC